MTPLKPENRARYPKDWKAIRAAVLERAGHRCECRGECGSEHAPWGGLTGPDGVRRTGIRGACRAPHGQLIVRDPLAPAYWERHDECPCDRDCTCGEDCDQNPVCAPEDRCLAVRVVLTIAHLNHTPEDNDMDNLRAFCQRCHLRYDAEHHKANAATTRHRRRASGDLFGEAP